MQPLFPAQIGFIPKKEGQKSEIIIGKDVSVEYEAIGFGADARPEELNSLTINISDGSVTPSVKKLSIKIDIADVLAIIAANPSVPSNLTVSLKEASVCEVVGEETVEKRMLILASQTYLPSS